MELPNWVIALIMLLICLVFILFISSDMPLRAIESVRVWVETIWGTIA